MFRYWLLMFALFSLAACGLTPQDNTPTRTPEAAEEIVQISTPTNLPPTATALPTPIPLATIAAAEFEVAIQSPLGTPMRGHTIVLSSDPLTITGGAQARTAVITYTVRRGDTVAKIAERMGLALCSVVWANPRHQLNPLRAGNVLDIPPVDGVFYRVEENITIAALAAETGVDPYFIIDAPYNNLFAASPETVLVQGMKIVVPGGGYGDCNIWAAAPPVIISSDGASKEGELWGCRYGVNGVDIPSLTPLQSAYTFFRGFTGSHTGVDLSAPAGSAIYAAGGGTVAFAGVAEGGYGNAVVIDHGASFTLYAHMANINVVCGQAVTRGQIIGGVGSTGISTGPHLHFELRNSGFGLVDPTLGFFF